MFWKILLGFWITNLFIFHAVAIAYAVRWGDGKRMDREVAKVVAPYQLSAAQLAIESDGMAKFREVSQSWKAQNSNWPGGHEQWNLLSVVEAKRVAKPEEAPQERSEILVKHAVDPESREWELRYTLPPESGSWSIRDFLRFYLEVEWAIPAVLGGLLFSAILAWYLSRPIQRLRKGFRKLADGQLTTRLQPSMGRRRDEIADLADDFDRMAEQLQQLLLARDQLLHDVSHELRSPLARLNLAVALAGQDAGAPGEPLRRIESEVGRLDDLVGELLSLSRGESGESELDAYFDMRALVDAVVADASFEARAKGVAMVSRIETKQQMLMQGSAKLIRRAIENIVRNATQFSVQGDTVEVTLSVDDDLHRAVLWIADRGPGVPEVDLRRMQDPFVRLQNGLSRQGYGLGLAIASRAVRSHRGTLVAANRPDGGLVVTVTLPLANMVSHMVDHNFENES
ncbi:ATP-binding protein [Cupriavidus basilensis]|uniref:histidine kinase n=1 Tax=Cupriavidus basilensis TaxID=68895 RepID=A0ABT6AZ02_9BURK|nr:ATP-binding protein [Cupriavidus basilensis]MDF3837844.1 ATP-binding protein [Cupriavidus basilensis]